VDECKPLPTTVNARFWRICVRSWCVAATEMEHGSAGRTPIPVEKTRDWSPILRSCLPTCVQGLTLAHFRAQLEDLRDTSLTLELNLSTCGTHPRVNLGCMGDKVSLS